jgi:hypothetical protein
VEGRRAMEPWLWLEMLEIMKLLKLELVWLMELTPRH